MITSIRCEQLNLDEYQGDEYKNKLYYELQDPKVFIPSILKEILRTFVRASVHFCPIFVLNKYVIILILHL